MNSLPQFARPVLHRRPWAWLLLFSGLTTIPLYAGDAAAPNGNSSARHPSIHINLFEDGKPTLSYALVRENDTILFVGNYKELAAATSHKQKTSADFLWVRKGQQFYLLDDAAVIAELLTLWQQVTPYEQQMAQLEQQMRQHTDELEEQAAELDAALAVDESDMAAIRAFERVRKPLEQKIEPIGEEMEWVGEQIESLSDIAHEQTVAAIETAIVSGKSKSLTTP